MKPGFRGVSSGLVVARLAALAANAVRACDLVRALAVLDEIQAACGQPQDGFAMAGFGAVASSASTPGRYKKSLDITRTAAGAASAIIDCHARARASKADSTAPAIVATTPTPLA